MYDLDELDRRATSLIDEAKNEVRHELDARLQEVDAGVRPFLELVHQRIYERGLDIDDVHADGEGEGIAFAECGIEWKTLPSYQREMQSRTIRAVPLPLRVPAGFILRGVGADSHRHVISAWKAKKVEVQPYKRDPVLAPNLDGVGWHRRTEPDYARPLAEILVRTRPDAFEAAVPVRRPNPGQVVIAPDNLLEEALRRPGIEIKWAEQLALPAFRPFFRKFGEMFLAVEDRTDFRSFNAQVFANAASKSRQYIPAVLLWIVGDDFVTFRSKRIVEAAIGLLPFISRREVAEVLKIKPATLTRLFGEHTGVRLFDVVKTIAETGSGVEFAVWIKAGRIGEDGRPGLEQLDVEDVRLIAGVLEAAVPGVLASVGVDIVKTRHPAIVVRPEVPAPVDVPAVVEDLVAADTPGLGLQVLAGALDSLAHNPAAQGQLKTDLLHSPVLQEPIINLDWFSARYGFLRQVTNGAAPAKFWYQQGVAEWQQIEETFQRFVARFADEKARIKAIRKDPTLHSRMMIWRLIHEWWMTPIGQRGPWGRLIHAAAKVNCSGVYDAALRQVGRGYAAHEELRLRKQLAKAEEYTACPPICAPGADPWTSVDYMNRVARVGAAMGRYYEAVDMLEVAILRAAKHLLLDQETYTILNLSKVLSATGVPTFRRLETLALKAGKEIRPALAAILSHSILLDYIYFAVDVDLAVIDMRLLDLRREAEPVLRNWIDVARGLVRLRVGRAREAVSMLSASRSAFLAQARIHDAHWVGVFLSLAESESDFAAAAKTGREAATYFSQHSHGPVRSQALRMVEAGQQQLVAALLDLGRSLIAPRAEAAPPLLLDFSRQR